MKRFRILLLVILVLSLSVAVMPVAAKGVTPQAEEISPGIDFSGFIQTASVGAIPLIAVIIGLVAYFKQWGVSGKKLLLVSMAIGLVLGSGYMITQQRPPANTDWFPVYTFWFGVAIYGLAMGLVASGVYDAVKGIIDKLITSLQNKS